MSGRGQSAQARLLAYNRPARALLYLTIAAGFLAAVCIVAQGYVLSNVVDRIFLKRQAINDVFLLLAILLALALLRAALVWSGDVLAQRAASRLKGSLRQDLTRHILDLGPAYTRRQSSGELVEVL